MQRILLLSLCFLITACGPATLVSTSTMPIMVPSGTPQPTTALLSTSTLEPSITPLVSVFTPEPMNTPWIFPSGLSIEEHPLAKMPEIEPLVLYPLEPLTQTEMLFKHNDEWGKPLSSNEYYSIGHGNIWVMQGNDKLVAVEGPTENGKVTAQVTSNEVVIFSTPIDPPGVTSSFRVLTVFDDHWVFEIAQEKIIPPNTPLVDSFFAGEIFVDGQSLNELHGYNESYGFQTIHGRQFYFYKRDGKIGVSYDGQEVALAFDGVFHYGCCSAGALNPRMAQNIIGFFAWRGDHWYYTEIGVFDQP
jgi:hypothetical protein